jgi:hypothetical protein
VSFRIGLGLRDAIVPLPQSAIRCDTSCINEFAAFIALNGPRRDWLLEDFVMKVLKMATGAFPAVGAVVLLCASVNAVFGATTREEAGPQYFVATDGTMENVGTKEAPWDIASALDGRQSVLPGSTVWLRSGVYRHPDRSAGARGFVVKLAGQEGKLTRVQAWPGERVTIDGGMCVEPPATYIRLQDLEITVLETNRLSRVTGGQPGPDLGRPYGGLHINSGVGCQYINLVIRGGRGGIGWWVDSKDSEVYGCIIADAGWTGLDRGHGAHQMYSQNKDGVKTVSDCIFTSVHPGNFSMHIYTEGGFVDNYLVEHNIAYNTGIFLIGGLMKRPSHNIRLRRNFFYNTPVRMGYTATTNEGGEFVGNVVVNDDLQIHGWIESVCKDNLIVNGQVVKEIADGVTFENNETVSGQELLARGPLVILRPNKYDPNRANLAIFNWKRDKIVTLDASAFLKDGDGFRLVDPLHFHDAPVEWGFCKEGKITVRMYRMEFAAFVMFRNP